MATKGRLALSDAEQCLIRVALRQLIERTAEIPAFVEKREAAIKLLAGLYLSEMEVTGEGVKTAMFDTQSCTRCFYPTTHCLCGDRAFEHDNILQLDAAEDRDVL